MIHVFANLGTNIKSGEYVTVVAEVGNSKEKLLIPERCNTSARRMECLRLTIGSSKLSKSRTWRGSRLGISQG